MAERIFRSGNIVRLGASFLGEPVGTLAYVYEEYNIGDDEGVSIITENGCNIGGFSPDEQEKYLKLERDTGIEYDFKNVTKLRDDFDGLVKPLFKK